MARVVLYAMGYRGDVLPYVPVARELARRGHQVRFVCPREFHGLLEPEPFGCVHSGLDLGPNLLEQHSDFVARWGTRLGGVMLPRLYFDKLTIPYLDRLFEVIDHELASADLLASHPFPYFVAGPAAERRGVPAVVLDVFPMLVPSRYTDLPVLGSLRPRISAAVWATARSRVVARVPTFAALRRFRERLGLDVNGWNFFDARLSQRLTIGLYSHWYQPRQPDWPESYQLAGFTPWLGPAGLAVPAEVETFLEAGDPPVLITLGTNAATAHPGTFVEAARALDALHARGLILTSNEAIAERTKRAVGDGHGVWPFLPLGPLLSRCRAVVHAGGHGTNAAALTAGLPSAITPVVSDQIWHARRIAELGIGVNIKRGRLHQGLSELLRDGSMHERAAALGQRLRTENGPKTAATLAESALAG